MSCFTFYYCHQQVTLLLSSMYPKVSSVVRALSSAGAGARAAAAAPKDPFPLGHATSGHIVVYGRSTSRVQKVTYLLEELQVPNERVILPSPAPAYLKEISPLGLVPAVRDGPLFLDGSNAICAYLAHKYGRDRGFFPEDSLAIAKAFHWGDYIENYLASPRLNLVYHGLINKTYPPSFNKQGCPSDAEMEGHIDATVQAMLHLDTHLCHAHGQDRSNIISSTTTFIATTDAFTFADAIAAPWLHRWYEFAATGDYGPRLTPGHFDSVMRYYDHLAARPAFQTAILNRDA